MIRHTGIVEDLRLDECGLTYLDVDPWAFAPFWAGAPGESEQTAVTFWTDLDRTCESIAAVCGEQDAVAYRGWASEWAARNERVFAAFQQPPRSRALAWQAIAAGRAAAAPPGELARQFLQPADQLLDERFGDERLKTALAWLAAQSGPPPHEVATADFAGWIALMHRRPPGRPVGGSGRLAEALAERLRRSGGALRLGDGAKRVTRGPAGRAGGVLTASGEHVAARAVLAGGHVLATLDLLDDWPRAAEARRRVRVGGGIGIAVRLGARELPQYPAASADGSAHHGLQLLAPSRARLREAYADYLAGRPPAAPAVLAMTFSALDPSIAPAGRHNISLWGQWHPYQLRAGERWERIAEREGAKVVAQVERAAPGFASSIEHMQVQTPADLERELGLVRGNVMHVEMGLDAMFALRPLPELAGYRTPIDGLYLCGASTHPGGGVFGASGRSAARVLLADRAKARRAGAARRGSGRAARLAWDSTGRGIRLLRGRPAGGARKDLQ
jgi:phytoene dehydrogenase-like protein